MVSTFDHSEASTPGHSSMDKELARQGAISRAVDGLRRAKDELDAARPRMNRPASFEEATSAYFEVWSAQERLEAAVTAWRKAELGEVL